MVRILWTKDSHILKLRMPIFRWEILNLYQTIFRYDSPAILNLPAGIYAPGGFQPLCSELKDIGGEG
jgi:hypothetical protein